MNPATQSAIFGSSFAIGAAILFVVCFRFVLARRRSPYTLLISTFALFLLVGPFAIMQLSSLQDRAGIVDPCTRDVGFYIYLVVLLALFAFAFIQIAKYNRRNHG